MKMLQKTRGRMLIYKTKRRMLPKIRNLRNHRTAAQKMVIGGGRRGTQRKRTQRKRTQRKSPMIPTTMTEGNRRKMWRRRAKNRLTTAVEKGKEILARKRSAEE